MELVFAGKIFGYEVDDARYADGMPHAASKGTRQKKGKKSKRNLPTSEEANWTMGGNKFVTSHYLYE